MAFGYLAITRRGTFLDVLNPNNGDPTMLLVIAYAIRRLPYMVRSTVAAPDPERIGTRLWRWPMLVLVITIGTPDRRHIPTIQKGARVPEVAARDDYVFSAKGIGP
jgi:hypothetical protein